MDARLEVMMLQPYLKQAINCARGCSGRLLSSQS